MSSADVVVVGAGLAGLTAAIALAERGARVEVVARGNASTHWTAGGIDVAAPAGSPTPREGVAALAARRGHPYTILGSEVPASLERFRALVAQHDLPYDGDLDSPIRPIPTSIGGTRPAAIVPAAQAAALAPWSPDERLVICGFAGFKDFWPEHIASSLTRSAVWGSAADPTGIRPARVESVTVELPGLEGRRNLTALTIARLFDDPATRGPAVGAMAEALARTGSRPGRVGLPAAIGLTEHATALAELAASLVLTPFEIALVPPSIPGLRLFGALRTALRDRGGRIVIGEPVIDVAIERRRVTAVAMSAAARRRTIKTGAVVLATGGLAGGGLVATASGELVETVLGLPVEAPPASDWLTRAPFDPQGHPVGAAGIRTDTRLRPVDADGEIVLKNVAVVGSMLAGMRYLTERCGDGVAIASGLRAAATLGASSTPVEAPPAAPQVAVR
jgi:glycerol-3-phosphate dehydrogenase subunit B